jgi:HEPN domain-containing protein
LACGLLSGAGECGEGIEGFIEATGKPAPIVHGLTTLLRECITMDREFGRFHRHCRTLMPYQSEARYPELAGAYHFTGQEALQAVRLARELFDFVRTKIEQRKEAGLL